jgi:hypothetical protein
VSDVDLPDKPPSRLPPLTRARDRLYQNESDRWPLAVFSGRHGREPCSVQLLRESPLVSRKPSSTTQTHAPESEFYSAGPRQPEGSRLLVRALSPRSRLSCIDEIEAKRLQPTIEQAHAETIAIGPLVRSEHASVESLKRLCGKSLLCRCSNSTDQQEQREPEWNDEVLGDHCR